MTQFPPRVVVVFGQLGALADPANLPAFRSQLVRAGCQTILIQHDQTSLATEFLRGYKGKKAMVGASLGAMSVIVFAKYMPEETLDFCGGFQPSDFDPSGVEVNIEETDPDDLVTRAIYVPKTIKVGLVFRNPVLAATGGLGHATWIAEDPQATQLTVVKRLDVHPGDFGVAASMMLAAARKELGI